MRYKQDRYWVVILYREDGNLKQHCIWPILSPTRSIAHWRAMEKFASIMPRNAISDGVIDSGISQAKPDFMDRMNKRGKYDLGK